MARMSPQVHPRSVNNKVSPAAHSLLKLTFSLMLIFHHRRRSQLHVQTTFDQKVPDLHIPFLAMSVDSSHCLLEHGSQMRWVEEDDVVGGSDVEPIGCKREWAEKNLKKKPV